jgi:cytoskeleton protein RodZ
MIKLTQMPLDNERSGDKDGQGRRRIHLREISGDSETPMETVGRDLRAARLRRGDEIAQVSRALKIRKDHLEALEEDRLEDLPGKTYAIGFVRSYARHLGLDTDQYVERFKQEISGRGDEHSREPAPIHTEEGRHLPHGWRIVAGIVILLLGYGVWHLMAPSGDSSQQVPPPPVLNPPKPKPAPAPQPVVAPAQTATPSPATDAVPPAPAANAPGQQAAATPPPAAGAKTPATSMTQMAAPTTTRTGAPQAPPVGAQTGASQPSAPQAAVPAASSQTFGGLNTGSRVIIRARGPVRVTVKGSDGSILLNRNLQAGDTYQAPNEPGITLATSDGGALEMDVDGKNLGTVGQPQQVLGRVSLEPDSLMERFRTH